MPNVDIAFQSTVVVALAFALSFAFGAITQKTNFCTMGGVSDAVTFGDWTRLRQWLLAIAVAILGTNVLAATGVIDTGDTFYTSPGCTIGQGLSGVSTLALGSIIATISIVAGAMLALKYQSWRLASL